ncbi:hypothetical protein FRC10_003059, partial [Ceratobasidium sp. 414]
MSLDSTVAGDEDANAPKLPENELIEGVERAPEGEYRVYIENYPVPTVGQPIRQATVEELKPPEYPDVGKLAEPDAFEIAH